MAAQTGRTNSKFVSVFVDNSSGTLTDLTAYLKTPPTIPLTYETQDVTSVAEHKNVTVGRSAAPLSIEFVWDTTVITHFSALAINTPLTLDIRMGVRQSWVAGEPQFGITSSATVGYAFTGMTVNGTEGVTCTFDVIGSTAPAFGTAAET